MGGAGEQKKYLQIGCGSSHSLLLDAHGHIWFWGRKN